jgi:hypothetical protein
VLEAFEVRDAVPLHDLPQLTATLAASLARLESKPAVAASRRGMSRRPLAVLRRLLRSRTLK